MGDTLANVLPQAFNHPRKKARDPSMRAECVCGTWPSTLRDNVLRDTVDDVTGWPSYLHFSCHQATITFCVGKPILMPHSYLLVKYTRNLFSMTRCIPNYSEDDIDFPTNNKSGRRRTIKLQVIASVSVTVSCQ